MPRITDACIVSFETGTDSNTRHSADERLMPTYRKTLEAPNQTSLMQSLIPCMH